MTPALAFNTAISFTTNTSWQNYPGESTLGHVGRLRGLAQYENTQIGNFWVDLVRSVGPVADAVQ
jgi:potassium-transporting ATPase potassium-binding subunit